MEFDLTVNQQQDRIISSFEEVEFARKISSLNNTSGGKLLVGVNDKGKIIGVYPKDELENIPIVIANFCSNPIEYTSEVIEMNNKLVLVLSFEKTIKIAALTSDKTLEYYYRIDSTICVANKIIVKLWSYERELTPTSPSSLEEEEIVYKNIHNITLSQLYAGTRLTKSVIDVTVSWLLFTKKVKMIFRDNHITYQHLS
jgi:predicted HTH transcriptional regulator